MDGLMCMPIVAISPKIPSAEKAGSKGHGKLEGRSWATRKLSLQLPKASFIPSQRERGVRSCELTGKYQPNHTICRTNRTPLG